MRILEYLGVVHILRNQYFGNFYPPPPSVINRNQEPTPPPPPPPRNQNQTSPTLRNENRTPPPSLSKTLSKALSEGRPPLCNSSSEAGALPTELRIENDSDRKFRSPKFLRYFLETTFLYVSCYPDHYEPKIFFRFFLEINLFRIENFRGQNILKVFLETTLVHVSCSLIIMSRKYFFDFRSSRLRFWTRGFLPLKMRSQKAGL